jgi:hypothetical protein
MKRMTLKIAALLISTLLLSVVASADPIVQPTVYVKNGDIPVFLTFNNDGTANIKPWSCQDALISGPVTTNEDGSYEIHREEGDVCSSSALVEMYHDVQYGENAVAEVRVKFAKDSPTGDHLCRGMKRIEGTYKRINFIPLQARCAPPANYGPAVAK